MLLKAPKKQICLTNFEFLCNILADADPSTTRGWDTHWDRECYRLLVIEKSEGHLRSHRDGPNHFLQQIPERQRLDTRMQVSSSNKFGHTAWTWLSKNWEWLLYIYGHFLTWVPRGNYVLQPCKMQFIKLSSCDTEVEGWLFATSTWCIHGVGSVYKCIYTCIYMHLYVY